MHRRVLLAAIGTGATAGLAGCSSFLTLSDNEPCNGDDCDIGMTRNEFLPDSYEATVGDPVVWRNTSGAAHTVTALEDSIPEGAEYFATGGYEDEKTARDAWHEDRGGRLGTRETFTHTFEVPGTYRYICEPHVGAGMIGEIIVTE